MTWTRLIAIVDEMAATLRRTAFSPVVREACDFSCVLLDAFGNSLAQATVSIPSFIGTLPMTAKHFLDAYPPHRLEPGDVLITNDPWKATGHLPDVTIATPIFHRDRFVALAGAIFHLPDIGGLQMSGDAREVLEEGLWLPMLKLYEAGRRNEDVWRIIEANVRVPEQVTGDLEAGVASTRLGGERLVEFLDEAVIDDLEAVAEAIHARSEAAMRSAIAEVPDGDYTFSVFLDGHEEPTEICCTVRIEGSDLEVDYSGSSAQTTAGINSVWNYTYAWTAFALKCVLDPETPNNEGSFRPLRMIAPEGSIVNAHPPAPVGARGLTGQGVHGAVFGALAQAIPQRIQAESGAPIWVLSFNGVDNDGRRFASLMFLNGGQGAGWGRDGNSSMSFPTNVTNTPVEIFEQSTPILVECKELIPDSGGAGAARGGLGQRVVLRSVADQPMLVSLMTERLRCAPTGLLGGSPGRSGRVTSTASGPIHTKGRNVMGTGETITFETPGGGGLGDLAERRRDDIERDLTEGWVTAAAPHQAGKAHPR